MRWIALVTSRPCSGVASTLLVGSLGLGSLLMGLLLIGSLAGCDAGYDGASVSALDDRHSKLDPSPSVHMTMPPAVAREVAGAPEVSGTDRPAVVARPAFELSPAAELSPVESVSRAPETHSEPSGEQPTLPSRKPGTSTTPNAEIMLMAPVAVETLDASEPTASHAPSAASATAVLNGPGTVEASFVAATQAPATPTPANTPSSASQEDASQGNAVEADASKEDLISAESVDGKANAAAAAPDAYDQWPEPAVALVFSGNQHGYIEPCGCTGLDRQKGGVARRFTFLQGLRSKGWNVVPIDAGNQVRRFGSQAEIKFHSTMRALKAMQYATVALGPDDIRLGVGELLSEAVDDGAILSSANVVLIDPEMMPKHRVIESGGLRIGVCGLLDPDAVEGKLGDEVDVRPTGPAAATALKAMVADSATFKVLTFHGSEEAAEKLVAATPGFDLVVVTGGYGEPTYQAESVAGSETRKIVTGAKGMYAGVVGLYPEADFRYARVPLTHEFKDAAEMRELMAAYQNQLKVLGLAKLGLRPVPHPSSGKFIGSKACAECHTTAWDIWESSAHAHATASIVSPPEERGDVARHFDPECISCHVTGWNAQDYYPYTTGYLSLDDSAHLTGNGCENCHGPGAAHTAAEQKGSGVAEAQRDLLRRAMQLPLDKAREKCMECHDLDNSPDFHDEDAFEDIYWPQVEHYGVD